MEDVRVPVQELSLARRYVTELTNFGWWTDLLESYLKTYRPLLIPSSKKKGGHNFVFVTRSGTPFTANYFSDFLSTLLFRHTGQRVATNILRSSFVTHFYSSEAAHARECGHCDAPLCRPGFASVRSAQHERQEAQGAGATCLVLHSAEHMPVEIKTFNYVLLNPV